MSASLSAQAVLWIAEDPDNRNMSEAARQFGITPGAVQKAWKKRLETAACPHCGQVIRQGEKRGRKAGT